MNEIIYQLLSSISPFVIGLFLVIICLVIILIKQRAEGVVLKSKKES